MAHVFYKPLEKQMKIAEFISGHETEIVIGRRITYIIKKELQ